MGLTMNYIDTHIHYCEYSVDELKLIIGNSKYKDIFLGYDKINYNLLNIDEYISTCQKVFLMPFVLKETHIETANNNLLSYLHSTKNTNIFPVPLITTNLEQMEAFPNCIGAKEHFYTHNCFEWANRTEAYNHLVNKLLILHCDNINRIDYVKHLSIRFPHMLIQIAHLGIFKNCPPATKQVIIELSKLKNVYFDMSTVLDENILKFAINVVPEKILFGSDIPYMAEDNCIELYGEQLYNLGAMDSQIDAILFENANRVLEKIL